MRHCACMLDALPRVLHEELKRLCEAKCKAQRKHGQGVADTRVSCIYILEFLGQMDSSLLRLWSNEDDLRMTTIVPQGKEHIKVIERELIDELNLHT